MKGKTIKIELKKRQILNDVSAECNLLGRTLGRAKEMEELAADIMTPAETATKPIVARAMTEGFGMVKSVCQSYLTMGRNSDDNRLEKVSERDDSTTELKTSNTGGILPTQLTANKNYEFRLSAPSDVTVTVYTTDNPNTPIATVASNGGRFVYTPTSATQLKFVTESDVTLNIRMLSGEFGSYELELLMPDAFNLGMTSVVKDGAHRLMVDYVMAAILKNQLPEKWEFYHSATTADADALRHALVSRLDFKRRSSDWD